MEFNETWQEARFQRTLLSLYICSPIGKTRWPPWPLIFWHISTSPLKPLNGLQRNLRGSKMPMPSTKFVFFRPIAHTLSTSMKSLNGIQRNLTVSKISTPFSKFSGVFFVNRKRQEDGPGLWLAETFSYSSLKPHFGTQRNLRGCKISTSSTKFVFPGPIGKTIWPPWPMREKGGTLNMYLGARYKAL